MRDRHKLPAGAIALQPTRLAQAFEHWDYYLACHLFRFASILQGIANCALDGNAAASDAAENGRKARPMAELGWKFAQRYDAARR